MSLNELEVLGSEKPIGLSKLDQDLANSSVGGGFEDGNKDDDKVKNVTVEIPAKDLKPAQTGIKAKDVIGIALDMLLSGEIGGDLGAIASSDSYIMDGHHRWAATYIIDPNAKLKVTIMDMPGEQLVTALNVITKGKLGIDVGNKEEGDIRSLNSHTLEPIIDSCIENGKPGNWPLTPEQVKQALSQVPGATNYTQGKDILLKNANLLPKNIMPNAPRRVDMPVIDQDKVDIAKTYLAKGSVDLKQPYSDKVATNISENIDDILTEWSYRIPKGYPTIVDGQFVDRDEVMILNQLLEEKGLAAIELPEVVGGFNQSTANSILASNAFKNIINIQTVVPTISNKNKTAYKVYVSGIKDAERAGLSDKIVAAFNKNTKKGVKAFTIERDRGKKSILINVNGYQYLYDLKVYSESGTDTDIKEGFSVACSYFPYQVDQLDYANVVDYASKFKTYLQKNVIDGLGVATQTKLIEYLSKVAKTTDKKLLKAYATTLNQNISHANTFSTFFQKNPDFYIERAELFNRIRSTASKILGMDKDKWCPGDVYFIKNGSESIIEKRLQQATSTSNKEQAIQLINSLFSDAYESKVSTKTPIVAVSLKQAKAQGGKLKSALDSYANAPTEYNLSAEELKFAQATYLQGIAKYQKEFKSVLSKERETYYNWPMIDIKTLAKKKPTASDLEVIKFKYAAYKALNFILNKVAKGPTDLDTALVSLTAFGLGLVQQKVGAQYVNPPFFKVIASTTGEATKPQFFKPGTLVSLLPLDGLKGRPEIVVNDSPKYKGIQMNFTVGVGDEKYHLEVNLRPNGMSQLTIELGPPKHI